MRISCLLLLCPGVLNEDLYAVLGLEFANEARVPELARNTKVLATAHEGVALARFGSGRDAIGIEVFLFTACNSDQPTQTLSAVRKK